MDEYGVYFLDIGTCTLYKTHNAFRKGVLDFGLDLETFVNDTNFFFKLFAARMHDYKLMEVFTEIEAKYVLRHISSRWLSIKKPLRILDQWENQDEYFLNTFQSKIILKLSIRNVHAKVRKPVIS